jgi:hypothetical protein
MKVLPDTDDLAGLGDRFERASMTPHDIVVVRALPAAYLRLNAQVKHWPLFVDYRNG